MRISREVCKRDSALIPAHEMAPSTNAFADRFLAGNEAAYQQAVQDWHAERAAAKEAQS